MTKYKFLCIDIGTTSLKAALVLDNGQVLSFLQVPYKINFSNIERFKISIQWTQSLKTAILEFCKFFNSDKLNVDAICISGNGPTIVSEDGTTFLWNEKLQHTNALDFAPSLFVPRLNEFKKLFPIQFKNQKIFSGPEFLIYKLCNSHITILPEERYKKAYWQDKDILSLDAKVEQFGKYVTPGTIVGYTKEDASVKFNLQKDIPVVAGGPDFVVAMIGTNTLSAGKICDCAGSSEGINLCAKEPIFCDGIRTLPSVIPGLWNIATLLPSSGRQFVECKKKREEKIKKELTYKEYILHCSKNKFSNGYRTMKKLAKQINKQIQKLFKCAKENNLPFSNTMTVTGGQAKNDWWMQLKANITNCNFQIPQIEDSELIGDAILCSVALGLYNSIQEAAEKIVQIKKLIVKSK